MDQYFSGQRSYTEVSGRPGLTATAPTDSPPEIAKVRDGITSAEQLQSALADEVAALERRLESVLRPLPPQGQGSANPTPQPVCSHVVGRLSILNDGFVSLGARLRELRERVEV